MADTAQQGDVAKPHLEVLAFDSTQLPKGIAHEGRIADGAHWRDGAGEHWLVISEQQRGMVADEDFLVAIFARSFLVRRGRIDMEWEIKEYNRDVFSGPEYAEGTLEVVDLDSNGLGESAFLYTIDTDGADPMGLKLMLHVEARKYAIRGQLAGMDYDRGKVEKKEFDPAFKEIDAGFKEFASRKWDAFEKEFYKGWPEVED